MPSTTSVQSEVCVSFCLWAGILQNAKKIINRFHWNLVLWFHGLTGGKNRWTFGGDTDSGSLFHFHQHCRIGHFRICRLLAFLMQSPAAFHETRRTDWPPTRVHYFGNRHRDPDQFADHSWWMQAQFRGHASALGVGGGMRSQSAL